MRVGMIDTQAIRQRWRPSARSSMSAGGGVRRRRGPRGRMGGLEAVSEITGAGALDDRSGLKDLDAAPLPKGRERRKGGGRQPLSSRDATLIEDLRSVIEPATLAIPCARVVGIEKPRQGGGTRYRSRATRSAPAA